MEEKKTYLTEEQLKEFKELLLQEKKKMLEILKEEEENFENIEDIDEIDIANSVASNELINRLSKLDFEKIQMIDKALEKIEKGTYGICEGTGKPIPIERLERIPWTPYTVEYAEYVSRNKKKK